MLDADCQKHHTAQRFAQLATLEVAKFGFVPERFRVQSCQEQATTAIAHVVFTGSPKANRRYQDTIALRQSGDGWKVVLPGAFGVKAK